jgi:hypothetical protein
MPGRLQLVRDDGNGLSIWMNFVLRNRVTVWMSCGIAHFRYVSSKLYGDPEDGRS